jgi:hypothetical protein
MKVLLVQQEMGIRETEIPILPIGLTYIAAALKDHAVKIFDPNLYPMDQAPAHLDQVIATFQPQVIGISVRNIDTTNFRNRHVHYRYLRPMAQQLKEAAPGATIVAGGSGFSLFARPIMERVPEIDFGVFLEGEEAMPELLANLETPETVKGIYYRRGAEVIFTGRRPLPDFAGIPMPCMDPDVIDLSRYIGPSYNIIGIQTKRGCLLQCGYCSYPFLNGDRLRLRSPEHIVDQIEYMVHHFGMERFVFADSVFNVPKRHAEEICREMIRRGLKVQFGAWLHMKGITREFLELLREAGAVQIDFSPDAATDKGLLALKKGITEADITHAIHIARDIKGVGFGFGFFSSLPGYTLWDTVKTIFKPFLIQRALPGRGGGGITFIRIEPYTLIHEIAVKEGLVSAENTLLAENGTELAKLFYRPPAQRLNNFVTDQFLNFFEGILKPAALLLYRSLARLSGRRSVYDQKTGHVSFQQKKKT